MAPVVYVLPDKLPLQPLALPMLLPDGSNVKVVESPLVTVLELGSISPPDPLTVLETV